MPHIIIEHTKAIAAQIKKAGVVKKVHLAVVASGLFDPGAVKSRAVEYPEICWGEKGEAADFVHVTVKILAGRTLEQRQSLSDAVFTILGACLPELPLRSVEIHEMEKAVYRK